MKLPKNLRVLAAVLVLSLAASAANTTIPAGTRVTVRLSQSIRSETANTGDTFDGAVANDVVMNGATIAHAGDPVKGKVTHAKSSGRLHAPGELTIRLTSINGQPVT